jgi:hypothetical protein
VATVKGGWSAYRHDVRRCSDVHDEDDSVIGLPSVPTVMAVPWHPQQYLQQGEDLERRQQAQLEIELDLKECEEALGIQRLKLERDK